MPVLTWIDVREMQRRLPDLVTAYKMAFLAGDHAKQAAAGNEIHAIGDRLARELAGCGLDELLGKQSHGYRPTLHIDRPGPARMLAEIYDLTAAARGLELRAYRSGRREQFLEREIAEQRAWILSCGGDLAGYVERYGEPGQDHCYGNGGTAIYKADTDELARLEAELTLERSRR